MTTRQQVYQISADILSGRRAGNKVAAQAAIDVIVFQNTLDVLGVTATDQELNDRIAARYAELVAQ